MKTIIKRGSVRGFREELVIVSNVLLILLFIKIKYLIREFSSVRKGAILGIDLANFCL